MSGDTIAIKEGLGRIAREGTASSTLLINEGQQKLFGQPSVVRGGKEGRGGGGGDWGERAREEKGRDKRKRVL